MSLTATINIRFRLKHNAIPQLHQSIGPDYVAVLVRPEIGSRMREVIADYTAEEVYSTKRQEIQDKIRGRSEAMLSGKTLERTAEQSEYGEQYKIPLDAMLNIYDTLLLGLELPASVVAAINRKIEQYYISEEYTFRVAREKKESERKIGRGGRHTRVPADRQPRNLGFLPALARHRGHAATRTVAEFEGRDHRRRQGRRADHPRQRGCAAIAAGGSDRQRCSAHARHDPVSRGGAFGENAGELIW